VRFGLRRLKIVVRWKPATSHARSEQNRGWSFQLHPGATGQMENAGMAAGLAGVKWRLKKCY
jgi:hypothetical protein